MNLISWCRCLARNKRLVSAVVIAFASTVAAAQDSWTPDHDGNGYNNSFERAIDIGQLTPTGVNIKEQLGVVPWGFDTRDFYKFVFPSGVNDFQLSVKLDEQPDTSMWINIYDQTQKFVYASIGSADETFSHPSCVRRLLSGGLDQQRGRERPQLDIHPIGQTR
jgi:hypothetical protein